MTETITHVAVKQLNGFSKEENFHALNGVTFKEKNGRLVICGGSFRPFDDPYD